MARITALETQKHDPERVNIYLDGSFAFGASLLVVASHGLHEGRDLSDEEVAALERDEMAERAYSAALNFLSFRPRSRREVEDYLRRRKVEPQIGVGVVERLTGAGLLDDREFARFWVENRQTFRPRGARALRVELRQKGLAGDIVAEALDDLGDEEETAVEAGRKKVRSFAGLEEREFFRRMVTFLQRRGFSYDVAARATQRLAAGEDEDGT